MRASSRFECVGCDAVVDDDSVPPFRCPARRSGDDIDHVLARRLDLNGVRFPAAYDGNPFLAFSELFHARRLARAHDIPGSDVDRIVEELDAAVAALDGHGFRITPCIRADSLSEALGFAGDAGVWVKDETGHVAGSHKARHLFGVLVYLEVARRIGIGPPAGTPLAIASCGNAALAAAVVARAARRSLEVFVPVWADAGIVARLKELGARVTDCPRVENEPGDPCVHRFREVVNAGAIPFTCQGSENGLTIEGGQTLGWELASAFAETGRVPERLFVQVGGGALASAVIAGLREARDLHAIPSLPRIHTVQTEGGHPLRRAYERVAARMLIRLGGDALDPRPGHPDAVEELRESFPTERIQGELAYAAQHRAEFMWPWEMEPHSLADGILDDETYDWHAVIRGMIETGGTPVVVNEDLVKEANELAQNACPNGVSYTGSAGLAGLLQLVRAEVVAPTESAVILLTGLRRV